jgi:hypothetical protein
MRASVIKPWNRRLQSGHISETLHFENLPSVFNNMIVVSLFHSNYVFNGGKKNLVKQVKGIFY